MQKLKKNLKQLISDCSTEQIEEISRLFAERGDMDELSDIWDFFDDADDIAPIPNEQNIYITFDEGTAFINNLIDYTNVLGGGQYNEEIDGPEEYVSLGHSLKSWLEVPIYIDSNSYLMVNNYCYEKYFVNVPKQEIIEECQEKVDMIILATIVWEITRFGYTEDDREQVKSMLK